MISFAIASMFWEAYAFKYLTSHTGVVCRGEFLDPAKKTQDIYMGQYELARGDFLMGAMMAYAVFFPVVLILIIAYLSF